MSWLSYLVPQVVARHRTSYNHDIRVVEEQGKYKLLVNGSRQSGEYVQTLWQHALAQFGIIPSPDVRKILVLGVAGGTVIHLLHAIFPEAKIEGVEIDEKMIHVGRKYFSLGTMRDLTLTVADANTFIGRAAAERHHWDLVVVDLFVGATVPPFVGEKDFLLHLKKILTPRGTVLLNYLNELEYEKLSVLLSHKLKNAFRFVHQTDIFLNRFFSCSNAAIS